ncbi:hypothetical protein ZWY2020_034987 [Hordeum vulgare]|nr:hypothetical protein ZWY2020_034987 [Hordeum vulgare]
MGAGDPTDAKLVELLPEGFLEKTKGRGLVWPTRAPQKELQHYVPETVHRVVKHYNKMNQLMPLIYVKLYTYQICRALAYIHGSIGVCHRDIKPQNLLVNPHTHQLKLCDFGSAKVLPLFPGESGVELWTSLLKSSREEIKCMNPNYTEFKFPQIKAHPWHKVFHKRMPPEAVDLISRLLQYSPKLRCTAISIFIMWLE